MNLRYGGASSRKVGVIRHVEFLRESIRTHI